MDDKTDSFSQFDFTKVTKPGKFLKFQAGKPVTLRILTKDPVVQEKEFTNAKGEINLSTKFCFICYNFTEERAQILSATPKMATTLQRIATDEDFGANLQQCDVKISPEGEMLDRVYDINVVRHSGNQKELTQAQIKECAAIDLDNDVQDNKGRLSEWQPQAASTSGYQQAKAAMRKLRGDDEPLPEAPDEIEGDEIDLNSIPF